MSELGQQLIQIVRDKASEAPDFIYRMPPEHGTCMYVHNGQPSCLIGHGLAGAGIRVPSRHNACTIGALVDFMELPIDFDEVTWLRAAQSQQDRNRTWGDAVAYADTSPDFDSDEM